MKQYDYEIESNLMCCLFLKDSLIEELFIDLDCFKNTYNKRVLLLLKEVYKKYKKLDLTLIVSELKTDYEKNQFIEYFLDKINLLPTPAMFYEYQQKLIDQHKDDLIKQEIKKYSNKQIELDELVENINKISNEVMVIKQNNKVTPEEMIRMIRNREKIIKFPRFWALNEKLRIKKKTVNVIGARPSEGKSALALNLFCDLAKEYKCIYFNMEMTEEEVYERMLGIEANIPIADINKPQTEYQDQKIMEVANKIYNYKYEVINGSKTVHAMKNKIIKEQRDEHCIVFIDYTGYIVGKQGQNDRERIGEAVRELNNITKDYDCTIFLIAQINRNGSDVPTMQDLKDSGEIEQTADTIILIHDENKEDNADVKEIGFLIPKCRGGKRNVRIPVIFDKTKQRFTIKV
jgi:replicative DNA helicase